MGFLGCLIVVVVFMDLCEGRGDQAGWNRDKAETEKQDDGCKDLSTKSYRVDISVTHGRQRRDGPPHTMENRLEFFRLSFVFKIVDSDGSNEEEHEGQDEVED